MCGHAIGEVLNVEMEKQSVLQIGALWSKPVGSAEKLVTENLYESQRSRRERKATSGEKQHSGSKKFHLFPIEVKYWRQRRVACCESTQEQLLVVAEFENFVSETVHL